MAQKKLINKIAQATNGGKSGKPYFLLLKLENVRCFKEEQTIDFSDGNGKHKQWTIILGDNGTGKTTLLRSMIMTLFFRDWISGSKHIVRELVKLPDIKTLIDDGKVEEVEEKLFRLYEKRIRQDLDSEFRFGELYQDGTKILLNDATIESEKKGVVAYGATRKAGETSISEESGESTYSTLFDDSSSLLNPEEWLLRAHYATKWGKSKEKRKKELELVKNILKKVLPDIDDVRFSERETDKRILQPIVEFQTPYGWVEAKDLSLGYRTSMAWVVDFASRMFDTYRESENPLAEAAVCLVDEIDLHLHPRWQREMIDYLTNLFPNTQFIVTTHSPLIVQAAAARDANFVVCKREGDHVVIDQSIEAVRGWRTDQLLTSDLFGLESSRDTHIEKLEKERRAILSKAKLTKAQEKRAQEISAELSSLRVMENPEDDKAMEIIRKAALSLQNEAKQ